MFRSVCSAYSPRCKTRDAVAMRPYDYSFFFLPPPPSRDINFPIPEFIADLERLSKKLAPCKFRSWPSIEAERGY